MNKNSLVVTLLLIIGLSACQTTTKLENISFSPDWTVERMYSKNVQDSFEVSVQYPKGYDKNASQQYPIVLLTDADLYFPLVAPIVHQYEEVGIWPPMILVGIGYGSLHKMDSLRNRDYLYPEALPSDEMETSGGGDQYYHFLADELIPKLEQDGFTNPKRILAGHSFGGYITLYTSLKQASLQRKDFAGFVSASPSLWYHDFYLQKNFAESDRLTNQQIFLSIGGAEDAEWSLKPFDRLLEVLESQAVGKHLHAQIYEGLGHMDVAMVSFLQGIGLFVGAE